MFYCMSLCCLYSCPWRSLGLEEIIFIAEVFTDICLMVREDPSGLHAGTCHSRLGRYSESLHKEIVNTLISLRLAQYERNVTGRIDDDSLVLGDVFGHLGDVSLQDVVTVKIGHFSAALDPDLVL